MKYAIAFLLGMLFVLLSPVCWADAVIFSGNDVKALKASLDLNGKSKVQSGSVDPTITSTSAPIGTIYLNNSSGRYYRKLDSGSSTNWVLIGQLQPPSNLLANPDWETLSTGWTASGGSYARVTTGQAFGIGAASYTPSAASQSLYSDSITVSGKYAGLAGQNGMASCRIKVASGSVQHYLEVFTASGTLNSVPIYLDTANYQKTLLNFVWPSSGSAAMRLMSGAASGPVSIDDCEFGLATNFNETAQANHFGSVLWPSVPNCTWDSSSTTYANYSADSDCTLPSGSNLEGYAQAPAVKVPGIYFSNIGPGRYYLVATGIFLKAGTTTSTRACWRFSDGTSASQGSCVQSPTSVTQSGTGVIVGEINYTTAQSGVTIQLQALSDGAAESAQIINDSNGTSISGLKITVYRFPPDGQVVQNPDSLNWRVDANISGANPDLGTSDQTSYVEITDGSLSMTRNTGSAPVGAVCSGTNASTVGNLTCSAGSEGVGVTFNIPVAGAYLACFDITHSITMTGSGAGVFTTFQIVETASAAQTILQEGKTRTESGQSNNSATAFTNEQARRICGTFEFSSSGQKTLRLMYEQDATATVNVNVLLADASASNGQRDIHLTVVPLNGQAQAAPIVNSVTSSYSGASRVEWANVVSNCGSSPCTIDSQSGGIASITRVSSGLYEINITAGVFSSTPNCQITPGSNSITHSVSIFDTGGSTNSATLVDFILKNSADTNTDNSFYVMCMGPR